MKYILVNFDFNPNWVKGYTSDYLIYDRSSLPIFIKDIPKDKLIKTPNIGNVDLDKLSYLIDNYDNLPEVFLWSKSNLFKFITKEEFNEVKDNQTFTPLLTQGHKVYEPICRYVDGIYEERNDSWYAPQFQRKFNTYNDWADYMELPKPDYLPFAPGGNYILTPKEIHKYPKQFYVKMKATLEYTRLPAEAHYCERSYYQLWK